MNELMQHWPSLEQVPSGKDAFPALPVSGIPIAKRVQQTLLAGLDILREEYGASVDLDEARAWLKACEVSE